MDWTKILNLLGQGGIAAALLAVIFFVGKGMIRAVDKLAERIDDHTSKDLEHHGEVKGAIDRLEGRIDGIMETTPVREQRAYRERERDRVKTPRAVPAGQYGMRRPPTRNDEDK